MGVRRLGAELCSKISLLLVISSAPERHCCVHWQRQHASFGCCIFRVNFASYVLWWKVAQYSCFDLGEGFLFDRCGTAVERLE
jgi:hypothetical protein